MDIAEARTLHARLVNRSRSDPTRSAGTLQDVIMQHGPEEVAGDAWCSCCAAHAIGYPCPTTRTIALGLRVPLPERSTP